MDTVKTGALIAQVRKEKELTQRDLAEGLHVSVQAVSKWENGKSCPDVALLEPLAERLDLTVTELLSGQRGEAPGEEAVRDSLRFGLGQLGARIRRWRGLFLLCAALLLGLLFWLGYTWVRDNTELLPQRVTTVRPYRMTDREFALTRAAGQTGMYVYQVALGDSVTKCTFQWELWTNQGLERAESSEVERYSGGRHQLLGVTFSTKWHSDDLRYGISMLESGWSGVLEDIPYMGDALGITMPSRRAAVDPEEGTILLVLTLAPDGTFYAADTPRLEDGRMDLPPTSETAKYLLLRLYCE